MIAAVHGHVLKVWHRGVVLFQHEIEYLCNDHEAHVDERRRLVWLVEVDHYSTHVNLWDLQGYQLGIFSQYRWIDEWFHQDSLLHFPLYSLRELLLALLASKHPLVSKGCFHPIVFVKVNAFLKGSLQRKKDN